MPFPLQKEYPDLRLGARLVKQDPKVTSTLSPGPSFYTVPGMVCVCLGWLLCFPGLASVFAKACQRCAFLLPLSRAILGLFRTFAFIVFDMTEEGKTGVQELI